MTIADEIKKLEALRESGVLSEEEFILAKEKELGSRPTANTTADQAATQVHSSDPEAANRWACYLHLSQLTGIILPLAGFVAPVIIWLVKKGDYPLLDQHFRHVVNWILSATIYLVVIFLLFMILPPISIFAIFVLMLLGVIFPLAAAVKANKGTLWRYPLSIRFL